MWLIRSLVPADRFRFVRNHLRRGVRYDSGFRWVRSDDDDDQPLTGDAAHRLRYPTFIGEGAWAPWAPLVYASAHVHSKTNLMHSKSVRKPLVAIILSILKCMFYSRTIRIIATASVRRPKGPEPARPPPFKFATGLWKKIFFTDVIQPVVGN